MTACVNTKDNIHYLCPGARLTPSDPNHKTQSYVAGLRKREMQEAWRFRWTNTPNHPRSGFTLPNRIPPSLCTTERFWSLNHRTFSCLIQCRTGHAHIGKYYHHFIPGESQSCACGAKLQTRTHILKECRIHSRHRHLLGQGRNSQFGRLLGTTRGIWKLALFIKRSKAMEKQPKADPERDGDKSLIYADKGKGTSQVTERGVG